MEINFLKARVFFYFLSAVLLLLSLGAIKIFGLKLAIDLSGGAHFTFEAKSKEEVNKIKEVFQKTKPDFMIAESENDVFVKVKEISPQEKEEISRQLSSFNIKEKEFEKISPQVGKELQNKAKWLVVLSLCLMIAYLGVSFSKMPKPLEGWKIGLTVSSLLFHDILITLGFLSLMSKFSDAQISIPVIISFLTLVGYGINNFIVVFDRLRENVIRLGRKEKEMERVFNLAINETLERQINSSLTVIFCLIFIFLFSHPLRWFSLSLVFGLLVGLYSSIFLAVPLAFTLWMRKVK